MAALLGAAAGCTVPERDSGEEPTSEVASPIINGTDVPDPEAYGVPLLRRNDSRLGCSGVLLTNNWVLTDAHCVVKDWPTDRTPIAPTAVSLELGREWSRAAEVRIHPTLDAALVRISTPFPMNGRGWGYVRPLSQVHQDLRGLTLRCFGYGERKLGTSMGALASASLLVQSILPNEFIVQHNAAQGISHGDSGGPCLLNGALIGINEALTTVPPPNGLTDGYDTAIWALHSFIDPVMNPLLANPHQRSVVWRQSDGDPEVWRMNGDHIDGDSYPLAIGWDWQLQGTGDFDGDGEADILWRSNTGQLAIWFMSYGFIRAQAYPGYGNTPSPVGPEWVVKGVGDFDGNGRADILWRRNDGQVGIWYMNGATRVGEAYPGGTDIYGIWQIQGIGDFDGNHKSDILWRQNTGQLAIWFGGNATTVSYPGAPGPEWQIKAVADFNGNGRSDILWRQNTGQLAIWYDANSASAGYPGAPGLEWQILGAGDFDGNGRSDILWRQNDPSGTTAIWFDANPALAAYPGGSSGLIFQSMLANSF